MRVAVIARQQGQTNAESSPSGRRSEHRNEHVEMDLHAERPEMLGDRQDLIGSVVDDESEMIKQRLRVQTEHHEDQENVKIGRQRIRASRFATNSRIVAERNVLTIRKPERKKRGSFPWDQPSKI